MFFRTLQSKVELMKEERERSVSGGEAKPEGVVNGDENVSSEGGPGARSCRESNSTDLKQRGRGVKEEEEKEEASGESMAASKESSASLRRRRKAGGGGDEEAASAQQQQPLAALLDRVAARFGPVFERLQESQVKKSSWELPPCPSCPPHWPARARSKHGRGKIGTSRGKIKEAQACQEGG